MALAVCLLFDRRTDRLVRQLWERLEAQGVATLLTHTHGRHHPHLSYAVLRDGDLKLSVTTSVKGVDQTGDGKLWAEVFADEFEALRPAP